MMKRPERRLMLCALALLLVLSPPAPAQKSDATPIGVVELTSETVPEAELHLLTDRLRHELVQTGRFRVMEREKMRDILKEQGFQQSGCFATECVVEIGQLIGVREMVAGSVGKIDNLYTLSIRLIDLETGEVVRTAVKDCDCPLTDILTKELRLVADEIAAPEPERRPPPEPTGTNEPTYVRGDIFTTVWTKNRSPYIVTGPLTVRQGNRLTIEPGVDVLFNDGTFMDVRGSVEAVGTEVDSIRFLRGQAASWGGIRFTGGDSSTLAYVRVSDVSMARDGGGIVLRGTVRLFLSHSVVSNNIAVRDGGGVCLLPAGLFGTRSPRLTMDRCVLSGNRAGGKGGGIIAVNLKGSLGNPAVVLTRCLIVGNHADRDGGGIYCNRGDIRLVNCTLVGNTAGGRGGGGYNGSFATLRLVNCVVWGNVPSEQFNLVGRNVAATYSDFQQLSGVYSGEGTISADPLFVDPAHGDYHLRPGSPCIDAGYRHSPRDPDGTRADIGAFFFDQRQGR